MTFNLKRNQAVVFLAALALSSCAGSPAPPPEEASTPQASTETPTPAEPAPSTPQSVFLEALALCPQLSVSNAPPAGPERQLSTYQPFVTVNGSKIAIAPVEAACLSSGFGLRGERLHKGIDLHHSDPVDVYAAANGRVKEKLYRNDYGNMLVIEHGDGVFARYAHLESFADGLIVGDQVSAGQTIGIMGNTASYQIPRHLHYEVLTGEWGTLSGSFGLTPVDLFAQLP